MEWSDVLTEMYDAHVIWVKSAKNMKWASNEAWKLREKMFGLTRERIVLWQHCFFFHSTLHTDRKKHTTGDTTPKLANYSDIILSMRLKAIKPYFHLSHFTMRIKSRILYSINGLKTVVPRTIHEYQSFLFSCRFYWIESKEKTISNGTSCIKSKHSLLSTVYDCRVWQKNILAMQFISMFGNQIFVLRFFLLCSLLSNTWNFKYRQSLCCVYHRFFFLISLIWNEKCTGYERAHAVEFHRQLIKCISCFLFSNTPINYVNKVNR